MNPFSRSKAGSGGKNTSGVSQIELQNEPRYTFVDGQEPATNFNRSTFGNDQSSHRTSPSFAPTERKYGHSPHSVEQLPMLQDAPKHGNKRRKVSHHVGSWTWEITSLLLAVGVVAGVCGILAKYNHHENPLWKTGITLNTIVSFGSMLFRICLMIPVASCISQMSWIWITQAERPLSDIVRFDEASRGPYGSLMLMVTHHVHTFAFIGAFISVISVGIGPFFQQSIIFYSTSVVDTGTAIPYASYSPTYNTSNGLGGIYNEYSGYVPFNMQSAIFNGYFSDGNLDSMPVPPFSCQTGNCTWDPFPTLAVGVQCRDAPEQYTLNCTAFDYESYGWTSNPNMPDVCGIIAADDANTTTRLRIGSDEVSRFQRNLIPMHFAAYYNAQEEVVDPDIWTVPAGPSFDLQWVRAERYKPDNVTAYIARNSTFESRQCKLYTGLQVISARVDNGQYEETVLKEQIEPTTSGEGNYTYTYVDDRGASTSLTWTNLTQIRLLMNLIMPFAEDLVPFNLTTAMNRNSQWSTSYIIELTLNLPTGPQSLQTFYLNPNFTNTVHILAGHVNNALRSADTFLIREADPKNLTGIPPNFIAPQHRVPGRVFRDKIHVAVRWEWMILPLALAFLALVLLIATIFMSKRNNVGIWRSSPLSFLLYSRWDEHAARPRDDAPTDTAMRREANGYSVRVQKENGDGVSSGVVRRVVVDRFRRGEGFSQ